MVSLFGESDNMRVTSLSRDDSGHSGRHACLDGVRGLAALMVAVGHTLILLQIDGVTNLWTTAFRDLQSLQAVVAKALLFLANGNAAVSVFFVLSGLVLTLSLSRTTTQWPYAVGSFIIRRIIRLYPPWFVSVIVASISIPLVLHFSPSGQESIFFRGQYQNTLTLETWIRNVLLASVSLNTVGWTLQVELLAAPLIVCWWGIRRAYASRLTDAGLFIAVAWAASQWSGGPRIGLYSLSLYLGSLVPELGFLVRRLHRWHPALPGSTLVPAVVMLNAAHLVSSVPSQVLYEAVGAAWCLAVVVECPLSSVRTLLLTKPIQFLGKISFSFYLLHFPLLYICGRLALYWIPVHFVIKWPLFIDLAVGGISIISAAILSLIIFHAVERPTVELGKQLAIRAERYTSVRPSISDQAFPISLAVHPALIPVECGRPESEQNNSYTVLETSLQPQITLNLEQERK